MRLLLWITIMNLMLLPSLAFSEDYPAGYLKPGYREYLEDKTDGYEVPVEEFLSKEEQQETVVEKKNQILEIISYSYQANEDSAYEILEEGFQRSKNAEELAWTVEQNQQQAEMVASNQSEFKYIKYSDGKIVRFTAGRPTSIENERVVDELGNVSIRNTYNMQYNDKRLLTGYQATVKDTLGNVTQISCYGIRYSPDSVFYGGYERNANKNEIEKYIEETDSAGNVKLIHWQALSYEGKLLRAFHQEIEDSVYGKSSFTRTNITYENNNYKRVSSYHEEGVGTDNLEYSLDRTNITYNDKEQISGYHEVNITIYPDGGKIKTTVDAEFTYLDVPRQFGPDVETPDPDRLLQSIITTTTENSDGAKKTETVTTNYKYDEAQQLIKASGLSVFTGQEASWWEYTDSAGHILRRDKDASGNPTYSYIDSETLQVIIVSEDEVTATLKDGNKYSGTSQIQNEILYGQAMAKQVDSRVSYYGRNISESELVQIEDSTTIYNNGLVNNLLRNLSSQEHTEVTYPLTDPQNTHQETRDISTLYFYDGAGNLVDAQGTGTKSAWEYEDTRGWWNPYISAITIKYQVILGKALRTRYYEEKSYQTSAE